MGLRVAKVQVGMPKINLSPLPPMENYLAAYLDLAETPRRVAKGLVLPPHAFSTLECSIVTGCGISGEWGATKR
jgi:hypothetical protein